jgi:hypothetical protein
MLGLLAPLDVHVSVVVHVPEADNVQGFGDAEIVPVGLAETAVTRTLASSASEADGPACNSNVTPAAVIHGTTALPLAPPVMATGDPLPALT